MKIAILVRPSESKPQVTPRSFHHADDLAQALGAALGIEVPVIEGALGDAPQSGYVIVFDLPREPLDAHLGQRIVAFNRDRSTMMKELEERGLAAGIDKFHSAAWHQPGDYQGPATGVLGRKDVIARMPAARMMGSGPFSSAHYAACVSDTARNLIELLAAYLTAYSSVRAG